MNDRHPSGVPIPDDDPGSGSSYGAYDADYGQSAYGSYGTGAPPADSYDGYATGSGPGTYGGGDPLFGDLPGTGPGTGTYATSAWDTGAYATGAYDTGSYEHTAYDAPYGTSYDTGGYPAGSYGGQADYGYPAPADGTGQWTFGVQETGGWSTGSWDMSGQAAAYTYDEHAAYAPHPAPQDQTGYETYGAAYAPQDTYAGQADHTGQFDQFGQHFDQFDQNFEQFGRDHAYGYDQDATGQWSFAQQHEYDTADTWGFPDPGHGNQAEHDAAATAVFQEIPQEAEAPRGTHDFDEDSGHAPDPATGYEPDAGYEPDSGYGHGGDAPDTAAPLASAPHSSRGRRRSPKPRRRALMTVAVPSVAVMGVAGAAAASVMGGDDGDKGSPAPVAAPDAEPVKPSAANNKLDTQLAGLSADADDFADRASRTQERIDLKERQEAERERKAKEAERKEAMRPKFVIPVKDHTLSAHYGQAGVNWMSVHTGIDFPVSYGTPVMAATDGTVTTKYDMSYGNMAIVTAKDGTETWYCHLSSTKIRSGEVKAGDTIAYSGSSGNSTGPHLHFEVRPGGGSAVDPIPWLQGKGLNIS